MIRTVRTILRIAFRDLVLYGLGILTGAVWYALLA